MKILKLLMISLLLFSCSTTTKKKHTNNFVVSSENYRNDTIQIKNKLLEFYKLKNKIYYDKPNYQRKILNIKVDTLIYGKDNKFASLILIDEVNKYAKNDKHISYAGECVIGKKKNDTIILINILTLKTFSSKNRSLAKKGLVNNYLKGKLNIKENYNINDVRFWDSKVWQDSLIIKTKQFYLKQNDSLSKTYP